MNPAAAAIKYALSLEASECLVFLTAWHDGSFDIIRKFWPTCPKDALVSNENSHPSVEYLNSTLVKTSALSEADTCTDHTESLHVY